MFVCFLLFSSFISACVVNMKLNVECQRAFLEQSLRMIKAEKSARFLKFLFISKRFLETSRFKHFKIYRFVLKQFCGGKPKILLCNHSSQAYVREHGFWLNLDYAVKLFILLSPNMLEAQFQGTYSSTINNLDNYAMFLEHAAGKISFITNVATQKFVPLLEAYSSKVSEFEANSNFCMDNESCPAMNLDFCSIRHVESVKKLKSLLDGQRAKRLHVSFYDNGDNFEYDHEDYFISSPVKKRKLNDDDLVNDSVTQLKLMSISHPSFRVMMKLIANANEHFPKAKNLHVNARFYDDEMFGHGEVSETSLINAIMKYYKKFQKSCAAFTDLHAKTSADFITYFELNSNEYKSDWIGELKKRSEFKAAHVSQTIHPKNGVNDTISLQFNAKQSESFEFIFIIQNNYVGY